MTSLLITGYRNMDVGIFQEKDPRVAIIKEAIRQYLVRFLEDGGDWLIFTGSLGFEYWALEVANELKESYSFQIATILTFENTGENWNEANQTKLAAFKQVDFVKYAYPRYTSPQQFIDYNQFMVDNTDGAYLFYDEENETNLKYLYQKMKEKDGYFINKLSFDDLNEIAEKFRDSDI